jgi:hypothetical protein
MDMKRIGLLLLCSFFLLGVRAQQEGGVRRVVNDSTSVKDVVPPAGLQSEVSGAYPLAAVSKPDFVSKVRPQADSLHLPVLNTYTGQPMMYYPMYALGGFNDWALHPGLNASFGASVMVGFGRHAYHGAGFAQNLSMMYAAPLGKGFSLAVGGYYSHLNWNGCDINDAGLSAVLGYHVNDRLDAYLYGQKTLLNPRLPRQLLYMNDIGDKIGASLQYHISPSATIGISVEAGRTPGEAFGK